MKLFLTLQPKLTNVHGNARERSRNKDTFSTKDWSEPDGSFDPRVTLSCSDSKQHNIYYIMIAKIM